MTIVIPAFLLWMLLGAVLWLIVGYLLLIVLFAIEPGIALGLDGSERLLLIMMPPYTLYVCVYTGYQRYKSRR